MALKFSQESFCLIDLPNLLINVWDYAEHVYHNLLPDLNRCVCKLYLEYCVEAARKK